LQQRRHGAYAYAGKWARRTICKQTNKNRSDRAFRLLLLRAVTLSRRVCAGSRSISHLLKFAHIGTLQKERSHPLYTLLLSSTASPLFRITRPTAPAALIARAHCCPLNIASGSSCALRDILRAPRPAAAPYACAYLRMAACRLAHWRAASAGFTARHTCNSPRLGPPVLGRSRTRAAAASTGFVAAGLLTRAPSYTPLHYYTPHPHRAAVVAACLLRVRHFCVRHAALTPSALARYAHDLLHFSRMRLHVLATVEQQQAAKHQTALL